MTRLSRIPVNLTYVNYEMRTLTKYGITSLMKISLICFRGYKFGGLNRFNSTHTHTHTKLSSSSKDRYGSQL